MKNLRLFGLLGIISSIFYSAAVVFSPLSYPGYQWMSQAVSDLGAQGSPSFFLWTQLSTIYHLCGIVSITFVVTHLKDQTAKNRWGLYLFALMLWISAGGYTLFPLTQTNNANSLQDIMHIIITGIVVILSIISLLWIIFTTKRHSHQKPLYYGALLTFIFMVTGAIGTGVAPPAFFGLFERFSVFSVTFLNAWIGYLWFREII